MCAPCPYDFFAEQPEQSRKELVSPGNVHLEDLLEWTDLRALWHIIQDPDPFQRLHAHLPRQDIDRDSGHLQRRGCRRFTASHAVGDGSLWFFLPESSLMERLVEDQGGRDGEIEGVT